MEVFGNSGESCWVEKACGWRVDEGSEEAAAASYQKSLLKEKV